jgi:hypothetical protein
MTIAILSRSYLRTVTPSMFGTQSYHAMSDRYRFVVTDSVLDIMEGLGYSLVKAMQ